MDMERDVYLKIENKNSVNIDDIESRSIKDLHTSENLLKGLFSEFGDVIPTDKTINISVVNLAFMANIIIQYSNLKLTAIKMTDAKSLTVGNDLLLSDPLHMDLFNLGVLAVLELVE